MEGHKKGRLTVAIAPMSFISIRCALISTLFASLLVLYPISDLVSSHWPLHASYALGVRDVCLQVDPLPPASAANLKLAEELDVLFSDPAFEAVAADYLGGAVRISTETFNGMGPIGTDPRWDIFYKFSEFLQKAFPKFHATLTQTRINTHALLHYWAGSDSSLKPILLIAHQDVVPVNPSTVSSWVHPPYSGHYDGAWVWGRGSVDDKGGLVAIMVALEKLIESGFTPKRGILIGLGMDEEVGGRRGALHIAKYIEEHHGKNGVSILIDEGEGFHMVDDVLIATPAVAERGYMNIKIDVATPGGHSSIPPEHTSIGILAALLVAIESTPCLPKLSRTSPIYGLLQCCAVHVPSVPFSFKSSVLNSIYPPDATPRQRTECDTALQDVEAALFDASSDWNHGDESAARSYRNLLRTTQAVDMINGGVKANMLPELASAVINYRIQTGSSASELKEAVTSQLVPLAQRFNLSFTSFSRANVTTGNVGNLTVSTWGTPLDSSPVTPTAGDEAAAYRLLSGIIKYTSGNKKIVVSPTLIGANTDTRHYWNVTPNIFRYLHNSDDDINNGVHTVNEAIRASGFVEMIRFFKNFILTTDDSTDI